MSAKKRRSSKRNPRRINLGRRQQWVLAFQLGILLALVVAISRCVVPGRTTVPYTEKTDTGPIPGTRDGVVSEDFAGPFYFGAISFPERPGVKDDTFLFYQSDGRYSYYYDTLHRQSAWVAYMLTSSDLENREASRSDRFRPDPAIREKGWPHCVDKDYVRSGYDRGHLLPSADRVGSKEENEATFFFSNISPQTPSLNRKIWKNLEEEIRRYAARFDTVLIMTGGIFGEECGRIGASGITVPDRFYKAILARDGEGVISAGFVIPNAGDIPGTYWDYSVSVGELEQLLGLEFFRNLPDAVKAASFRTCDPEAWRKQ